MTRVTPDSTMTRATKIGTNTQVVHFMMPRLILLSGIDATHEAYQLENLDQSDIHTYLVNGTYSLIVPVHVFYFALRTLHSVFDEVSACMLIFPFLYFFILYFEKLLLFSLYVTSFLIIVCS